MPELVGLQNILYPAISGGFPVSVAESPTGDLLIVNGLDLPVTWDVLAGVAATLGVAPPASAMELGGIGPGGICGQYVAFTRFLDRNGNPSVLSPVSNAMDTGYDGWIESILRVDSTAVIRSQAHGLVQGDAIVIAAIDATDDFALCNGTWSATPIDADTFSIPATLPTTAATYQASGVFSLGIATFMYGDVPLATSPTVARRQILRNLSGDCDVLYVDVDTTDLTSTVFSSTQTDEQLATCEAVPLNYGEDDLPWANRFGVPPSHKSAVAVHNGRGFLAADVSYSDGHCEPLFNQKVVQGVGTQWRANWVGRLIYITGASNTYEIASIDEPSQVMILTAPYLEPPAPFASYTIRPAPGERRLVYYSEPGTIESWPAYNALAVPEDSDDIVGLIVKGAYLYVIERRHLWRLTFQEDPLRDGFLFRTSERGCLNNRCWVTVEGNTFMLDEAGIHSFDGGESLTVSDEVQNLFNIDGTIDFQVDWTADQTLWHAAHDPVRTTIRWFVAFVGRHGLDYCLAYNYRQKRFWIEQYPSPVTASCVGTIGYRRSLAGTAARRVIVLAEGAYDGVDASGTLRGTATAGGAFSLTDTLAEFADLEGAPVTIVKGTGHGQSSTVATNTGTVLQFKEGWATIPDRTSVYQVGGIAWSWRSGWFRFADDEGENPRDIELVYEPLAVATQVYMLMYFDHDANPRVWDYSQTDDGRTVTSGDPFIWFTFNTEKGYMIQRMSGHADAYAFGDHYVSLELGGVQSGDAVRIHEIYLSGAGVG